MILMHYMIYDIYIYVISADPVASGGWQRMCRSLAAHTMPSKRGKAKPYTNQTGLAALWAIAHSIILYVYVEM